MCVCAYIYVRVYIHTYELAHVATHWNTLEMYGKDDATHCNTLQHTATHCNTLRHTATRWRRTRKVTQHTTTNCNTTHCNTLESYVKGDTLQHTTTECNISGQSIAVQMCHTSSKKFLCDTFEIRVSRSHTYIHT